MQVYVSLTPCVESAYGFKSLKVQRFQAVGFKYQLAPPYTPVEQAAANPDPRVSEQTSVVTVRTSDDDRLWDDRAPRLSMVGRRQALDPGLKAPCFQTKGVQQKFNANAKKKRAPSTLTTLGFVQQKFNANAQKSHYIYSEPREPLYYYNLLKTTIPF